MMSMDLTPLKSCPEWEELKAWVDQELEPARQAVLGTHVAACVACREETRLMRQIGETLRQLEGAVEPSAALRERILARVGERSRAARWTLPSNPFAMLRWVTVATAVLVVGWVGRQAVVTETTTSRSVPSKSAAPSVPSAPAASMAGGKGPEAELAGGARAAGEAVPAPAMDAASPTAAPADEAKLKAGYSGSEAYRTEVPSASAPEAPPELRARRPLSGQSAFVGHSPQPVSPSDVNRYTRGKETDTVRRKVVRRAELAVRTRSPLESVQKEIQTRLQKDDGYVESSNLTVPTGAERTARMTLRVPVEKLDEYLAWLSGLGEVQAKNVRGEDVTGTWVDQRAEVRELRREEKRLLEIYRTHRSRERRDEARRLLLLVRPRIAIAEERFALTGKLAALSTLALTLIEPEQVRVQGGLCQDLDHTARAAVAAFMVALRVPAALVIWLVVFSPLWVPCLLLYRWATRKVQQWPHR